MRKSIITLLVLGALAGGAQSAFADDVPQGDDPFASFGIVEHWPSGLRQDCSTRYKDGVPGEGNAWGSYIAGCTMKIECPATKTACLAKSLSDIQTLNRFDDRVTLNSRIRMFGPGETETDRWRDTSCEGVNSCAAEDRVFIKPGESASLQCNGVHAETNDNPARVFCTLALEYR